VSELRLGPFRVRTERARIEGYRQSIGARGDNVPAAFPICWLAQPDIRSSVEQACGERLPLHEGQTFDYARPLAIDGDYLLSITLKEEASPARLTLEAEVATPSGEPCLRMQTLLRLVARTMELST
jgi:hypothetical protein